MIKVTRFDGSVLTINAALVEFVEATPDTVISMFSGRKLVVREPVDQVIKETVEYLQRVGTLCLASVPDEGKVETKKLDQREAESKG